MSTGLGIESEDLELPLENLPEWEQEKVKVFPVVSSALLLRVLSGMRLASKS